jgi:uncharacterized protein with von Willebrand factor type A (vWA) domain
MRSEQATCVPWFRSVFRLFLVLFNDRIVDVGKVLDAGGSHLAFRSGSASVFCRVGGEAIGGAAR